MQIEQALFGTRRYDDLLLVIVQCIVAFELALNGLFERQAAVNRRVLGIAGGNRGNGGILDEPGCIEVGLSRAETDDVAALGTQPGSQREHGAGRRGLHPRHA